MIVAYPICVGYFGGNSLALSPKAWTNFATYFGGIVAPVISLYALVYVAQSLREQSLSNDALKRQVVLGTLRENVERYSKRLSRQLRTVIQSDPRHRTIEQALNDVAYNGAVPTKDLREICNSLLNQFALFSGTVSYYCSQLQSAGENDRQAQQVALSELGHWKLEFGTAVSNLLNACDREKIPEKEWVCLTEVFDIDRAE